MTALRDSTLDAVAAAANANFTAGKRYVAVVVDDRDEVTHVSAHGTREKAQRTVYLQGSGWLRGYVACRDTRGNTVVLSGEYVMGVKDRAAA
jgi:hypothetical protein